MKLGRRTLLRAAGSGLASAWFEAPLAAARRPGAATTGGQAGDRPKASGGVQCGDPRGDTVVVWSRCDRSARMIVEWARDERFSDPRRVAGPAALEASDFTARALLTDLPTGEPVFYRVVFQDLADLKSFSEPAAGQLRIPPAAHGAPRRPVTFAWSGDTAGQGWGIDPSRGGMLTYESIRRAQPDFFIHSGDTIYADNPIQAEVRLDDGSTWKNLVTPEKSKVAELLDDFRGCYRYNLQDEHLRRFNSEIAQLVQWDDHETLNNWFPGKRMDGDGRYREKSVDLLAARAKRAFLDYAPVRFDAADPERIYRAFRWGPLLEVLMLDERSYRGPNTPNRQETPGPDTAFLGSPQLAWLKRRLLASTATWKVIASDMPLGLVVGDAGGVFEAWANGNGPPLGRELELAQLLRFIKAAAIRNVVWVTADVHYAAAHHYDPARAQFTDFLPFWEFVAGPLHAGNFGPARLDNTFGPEVRFSSAGPGVRTNRPPSEGHQYFGLVRIDPDTRVMTVGLHNRAGTRLYSVDLEPER